MADDTTPYNRIKQASSHNSFQTVDDHGRPNPTVHEQLTAGIRSIEYDIHADDTPGHWRVYHDDDLTQTHCQWLYGCLNTLSDWRSQNRNRNVVTVWLDVMDPFVVTHTPSHLDALITSVIDPAWIYKPRDLMSRPWQDFPPQNLQDAAHRSGWPAVGELRGKFIFVLTGGHLAGSNAGNYLTSLADSVERLCFVAVPVNSGNNCSPDAERYFLPAFYNFYKHCTFSRDLLSLHVVSRVWCDTKKDDFVIQDWVNPAYECYNHIATDNYRDFMTGFADLPC
jgi:hypothetical protein